MIIVLDLTVDVALEKEGNMREVQTRVQKLRKSAGLSPTDDVVVYWKLSGAKASVNQVTAAIKDFQNAIETTTKSKLVEGAADSPTGTKYEKTDNVNGATLSLTLFV